MARQSNQKSKLLYISHYLLQESDETHPVTTNQIIAMLEGHGISAERKSIYDDIETLCEFGMDIITVRGRSNSYYLGARDLQLPEVKLLVDAVQSAKFITAGKSQSLIQKICRLASRHQAQQLQRQVYVRGRSKTSNERTYYNVDAIQSAISENRQITFHYFEWAVDHTQPHLFVRRLRRGGSLYTVSPFALLWDDEYYYLVAYDDDAGIIKHYRVDKMSDISLCTAARTGQQVFGELDMAEYTKSVFGMFGGKEEKVRLRFANSLIGVVVDRFGPDIIIHKSGNNHFTTTISAVVSPQFFSWVFGFGASAQILAPDYVVQLIAQEAHSICALYPAATGAKAKK